ncbi:hypothetical protein ASPBRDRAFT_38405 [Aspergillus brasiliensis CBS 101740]|uniref:Uncharacterized protein n=1 Tax=Aspergillus brasiliensis (strain CBS 101740 / IMI 381727 / IBT 21946) TaxID=767769 RepID=A0A1L9UWM8_ASPBC|nr:hypothetical protein ASPBRDRAFT_38405 [Aspergillus brasiliensis CBS 101740]
MTTERKSGENPNPNQDGRSRQREPRERLPPRKNGRELERKWLTDAEDEKKGQPPRGEARSRGLVRVMSIGIVEVVKVGQRDCVKQGKRASIQGGKKKDEFEQSMHEKQREREKKRGTAPEAAELMKQQVQHKATNGRE